MTPRHNRENEEYALITFIGLSTTGPILREIAERRLADLRSNSLFVPDNSHTAPRSYCIPCMNIETGEKFESLRKAAESLGVLQCRLGQDVRAQVHQYPIRLV